MRWTIIMAMTLISVIAGCKKDDNNDSQGSSGPPDTWVRVYEADSASEFASGIAETSDGGFVLAGSYASTSGQGNRVWKVNSVGDTLWSRSLVVGGAFDLLNGVTALPGGGALITGRVTPTGGSTEETILAQMNESGSIVWQRVTDFERGFAGFNSARLNDGSFVVATLGGLMKINANGDTLWTRSYGSLSFLGVIGLDDGGAIATGNHYIDTENAPATVLRCNAQGDSVWSHEFPLPGMRMYPWQIVRTGDGDYVAAGQYEDFPSGDQAGGWAAKFSESGQVRWSNTYAENGYFYDVATGPDGLPVVVGGIERAGSDSDILLMKLDNSGNEVWTRTFLSALDESAYGITATSDGGFVIVGTTGGVIYPDIILIKVDENGEI